MTKDSRITCYVEDDFYDKAKNFLKQKRQRQLGLSRDDDRSDPNEELTKWEQQMITRKKWIYSNNKLFTENKKEVVPKQELFQVLSHTHSQVEFPTEEGKLQKSGKSFNEPCEKCPAINASSNISLFDRDQLNGFSQVLLRL